MNWYPAAGYDGYYTDRLDVSKPESTTVDGQQSDLFRYSDNDFAAMLKPDGTSFAELRAQGDWNGKAAILAVFAKVKKVDVHPWRAAAADRYQIVPRRNHLRRAQRRTRTARMKPVVNAPAVSHGIGQRHESCLPGNVTTLPCAGDAVAGLCHWLGRCARLAMLPRPPPPAITLDAGIRGMAARAVTPSKASTAVWCWHQ